MSSSSVAFTRFYGFWVVCYGAARVVSIYRNVRIIGPKGVLRSESVFEIKIGDKTKLFRIKKILAKNVASRVVENHRDRVSESRVCKRQSCNKSRRLLFTGCDNGRW